MERHRVGDHAGAGGGVSQAPEKPDGVACCCCVGLGRTTGDGLRGVVAYAPVANPRWNGYLFVLGWCHLGQDQRGASSRGVVRNL
jgi:hypothetical protein